MSRKGGRDWRALGCAALIGASVAFPAGLFLGADRTPREHARGPSRAIPPEGGARNARNLYSPRVAGDPYVIAQQRKVLRALESSCSQSGHHCAEAEQARLRIEEAEAAR